MALDLNKFNVGNLSIDNKMDWVTFHKESNRAAIEEWARGMQKYCVYPQQPQPLNEPKSLTKLELRVLELEKQLRVQHQRDPLLVATNEVLLAELRRVEEENHRLRAELAEKERKLEEAHVRLYKTIDHILGSAADPAPTAERKER